MAIIREENIPAEKNYWKEVVYQIAFEGTEMDMGQGVVRVTSAERLVAGSADDTPVLTPEGAMQYRRSSPTLTPPIQSSLAEEVGSGISIDGITPAQVFSWLSKWTDYKKGEDVPGLVLPDVP